MTSFKENNQQLLKIAASSISQLFANNNHAYDEGYAQGRQDAYEEVFKWFTYQHDNSLRHVSVTSFFNFISEKLNNTKSKFAQSKANFDANTLLGNSNDRSMDDIGGQISSLNRFSHGDDNVIPDDPSVYHPSFLSKKVNINFSSFSGISDNRKRRMEPLRVPTKSMDEQELISSEFANQSQNASNAGSSLPFALRTGGSSLNNPFTQMRTDPNEYVFLPKRKKNMDVNSYFTNN